MSTNCCGEHGCKLWHVWIICLRKLSQRLKQPGAGVKGSQTPVIPFSGRRPNGSATLYIRRSMETRALCKLGLGQEKLRLRHDSPIPVRKLRPFRAKAPPETVTSGNPSTSNSALNPGARKRPFKNPERGRRAPRSAP